MAARPERLGSARVVPPAIDGDPGAYLRPPIQERSDVGDAPREVLAVAPAAAFGTQADADPRGDDQRVDVVVVDRGERSAAPVADLERLLRAAILIAGWR
jgi:hypothetical protein